MRLSENEIKIIELLREAKPFSKISITKKAKKDNIEYQIEVKTSQLFVRGLDNSPDGLL